MAGAYLRDVRGGAELELHVQPRASKTSIAGEHDGRLKVRLAAPPVDGAANEALVRFLAEVLDLPRKSVEIAAGETGRRKRVRLLGIDAATALTRLNAASS